MKRLYIFMIAIIGVISVYAQEITGKITDANTGLPLSGVFVRDLSHSRIVRSASDGEFSLPFAGDSIVLEFQKLSYKTKTLIIRKPGFYKISLSPTQINLKQVVVVAAPSGIEQTPMQTLTKIDLQLKPVNTSQEILRLIPGLFLAQHEGGGKAEQIFLRGFDMDHGTDISINVDGLPVNMVTHAHGQGYADLHFLIPETVDYIQFEKGCYNPQYGDFQTGAYVNFKTKDRLPYNVINIQGGSFNTARLLTMFNLFDKNDLRRSAYIASEYMITDGFFDRSQNFNRLNIFLKYIDQLSDKTSLTMEGNIFKTRWDAAGLIPERAVSEGMIDRFGEIDSSGGGMTHRNNLIFKLHTKLNNHSSISNNFYFTDYGFNLFSDFTFFLHDSINGDGIEQSEKRKIYGYNFRYLNVGKNSVSLIGGGFRYDDINDLALSHVHQRELLNRITLNDVDQTNAFFFAQQSYMLGKFTARLGLRGDYFYFLVIDKLQPKYMPAVYRKFLLSPKLTLSYNVNTNMQIYWKAGKGFHSNDARVIEKQNQDVVPIAYGSDLGIIYRPVSNVVINAALWYLYLRQEFTFSGDEGTIEANGPTQRKGFDLSAHLQLTENLYARLDVNYAIARKLTTENMGIYVPLAPRLSSMGGLYLADFHGFSGSITYRYLGVRPADDFNHLQTQPYTVVDASADYHYKKLALGLSIENLLNTPWRDAQFETTTRLPGETEPHTDICFTPGTPFSLKVHFEVRL